MINIIIFLGLTTLISVVYSLLAGYAKRWYLQMIEAMDKKEASAYRQIKDYYKGLSDTDKALADNKFHDHS